ncbi:MAG: hypothetical protein MI867_26580 [Pseudomonadales bacterium]|nr:hypothetical protein [Pseudomonadales bacterium]
MRNLAALKQLLLSPRARVMMSALLSAITWFCWAYWVNIEDSNQALTSGLSQGVVNLFTTAIGSAALEYLFRSFGGTGKGKLISILSVSSFSLALMIFSHILAGTPNIFLTVLPVYCVVLVYCSAYVLGLDKLKKHHDAPLFSL